jgi:hypothetical protein
MITSISQPTLFPWLGYFDMIKKSDVFVFLDNVKFEKSSWQMRNRLKTISKNSDHIIWIRIPTKAKTSNELIKNIEIDNSKDWKKDHLKTFEINYGKKTKEITFLQELYKKEWTNLADFNIEFITKCCKFLEINTKIIRASDLSVKGKKSYLVLDICKNLNTTKYLANPGSKQYLENDKQIFENEKIQLEYHNFKHPHYNQKGVKFIEKLSVLDLIFNEKNNSLNIIS